MDQKKTVLLTGNLGYIGSVLTEILIDLGYRVRGYDAGYFEDCLIAGATPPHEQIRKDIRDIGEEDVRGCDAVIHLAALSNDPLGELSPHLTEDINFRAAVQTAEIARTVGVSRFVYASSQSMYGISDKDEELDEDNSEKHPLTAYAKTKWQAECALKELADDKFLVACYRPSTVFGASPRLRCDIVFNNLVACAYTTGRVEIKSDGTPWRPVVHVRDVAAAFLSGLTAPPELINRRSFNVGIPDGNFTVRQLAEAAGRSVPGCSLAFTGEHGADSRTYRVSFARILRELRDHFQPAWDLDRGGTELVGLFKETGFSEQDFRGAKTTRLARLREHLNAETLDGNLRWVSKK